MPEENIFGKIFFTVTPQRGKQGKIHIVTSFSEKYVLLYTKESLQERSKAKVPGEKSWTKDICHIIINAKLQLWGCEILYFCCVKKIINERLRYK